MTAPAPYNRLYSFTSFQASSPATPLPANEVDAELSAIKVTLDAIIAALAIIQRNDGALANASVGPLQLSPILSLGFAPASVWSSAGVSYSPGQTVFSGLVLYVCLAANVSTATAPSADPTNWGALADFSGTSLAPGSVTTTALAAQAVTTAKLALSAVGTSQIAGGAVDSTKIAANAVTGVAIAAATIDFSKINSSGLPTTIPAGAGVWWLDGGVLSLSQ